MEEHATDGVKNGGEQVTLSATDATAHPDTTKLSAGDNPANFAINELTTLYDASDGGTAEWWPEHLDIAIGLNGKIFWVIRYFDDSQPFALKAHHALDIVRGSAERWLRASAKKRGETWGKANWGAKYGLFFAEGSMTEPDIVCDSLADAILAEMGRSKKLPDSSTPAT